MNNHITARVIFSFQGALHAPAADIDLDAMMAGSSDIPDIHALIAQTNGIDTYSYLYEVMLDHEIEYDNATGLAATCLVDGRFAADEFARRWQEEQVLKELRSIARQHLSIDDLERNDALKAALLAAYRAGREAMEPAPATGGYQG